MAATVRVYQWVRQMLTGDAQIAAAIGTRVYDRRAPEGTPYTLVIVQFMGATPLMVVGAARVWFDGLYLVKIVGKTNSPIALEPLADRIDTVLHGASGTVTGANILTCTQSGEVNYPDQDGQHHHLGAEWRIRAQRA